LSSSAGNPSSSAGNTDSAGRTPTTTNYAPAWVRARTRALAQRPPAREDHRLDLRHSAATTMLRAKSSATHTKARTPSDEGCRRSRIDLTATGPADAEEH